MRHKYTPEQFAFIEENVSGRSQKEMTAMFNAHFRLELSVGQMKSFIKNHHLKSNTRYTDEQIAFIASNVKGRSYQELTNMFNKWFGTDVKMDSIIRAAWVRGLRNGLCRRLTKGSKIGEATQFRKGMTPWNKGMKGINIGGKQTQFAKGNKPWNYKPVGTERINAEGYVDVKIADPKTWKAKHVIIWEEANGPVPAGHCLIFSDGNQLNVTLDNLLLISRSELAVMNKKGLISGDSELTKTGVVIADIYLKIGERKKKNKS
jgi:hypothetical protein